MPEVTARVGPYKPDFLWREERLVVEVDGYRYHSDRATFRADRVRDRYLSGSGSVQRFADDELRDEPAVAASPRARFQSTQE